MKKSFFEAWSEVIKDMPLNLLKEQPMKLYEHTDHHYSREFGWHTDILAPLSVGRGQCFQVTDAEFAQELVAELNQLLGATHDHQT